ncbi:hypothetical protein KKA47_00160 [bacterium]|nr:hypothetical protein [bacterium]
MFGGNSIDRAIESAKKEFDFNLCTNVEEFQFLPAPYSLMPGNYVVTCDIDPSTRLTLLCDGFYSKCVGNVTKTVSEEITRTIRVAKKVEDDSGAGQILAGIALMGIGALTSEAGFGIGLFALGAAMTFPGCNDGGKITYFDEDIIEIVEKEIAVADGVFDVLSPDETSPDVVGDQGRDASAVGDFVAAEVVPSETSEVNDLIEVLYPNMQDINLGLNPALSTCEVSKDSSNYSNNIILKIDEYLLNNSSYLWSELENASLPVVIAKTPDDPFDVPLDTDYVELVLEQTSFESTGSKDFIIWEDLENNVGLKIVKSKNDSFDYEMILFLPNQEDNCQLAYSLKVM